MNFLDEMKRRRTVRDFSDRAVPAKLIENAIAAAGTAPSGANMQPWYFVAVQDEGLKRSIRLAAEKEEKEFYGHRASEEWLGALEPFGTNDQKPFLETAPWLIGVFLRKFSYSATGERKKNYYTPESVGIATGILITSLHTSGLATLTHTPSPMGFLRETMGRPKDEKPYLLVVTGYPGKEAMVPDITRKPLNEVMTMI